MIGQIGNLAISLFQTDLLYSVFKPEKLWLCRPFSRDSRSRFSRAIPASKKRVYAVKRNYARRIVKAHRGRFYERLRGIIINELKCGWKPLSFFLSLGRRLPCRHSGVRASPAICSADRLTILAVTTLIARGISTLTGRTDRLKDALRESPSRYGE